MAILFSYAMLVFGLQVFASSELVPGAMPVSYIDMLRVTAVRCIGADWLDCRLFLDAAALRDRRYFLLYRLARN
jgi:hypothetical protein